MVQVAIFGIHGLLGSRTINAFLSEPFASKVAFPLRIVTSDATKKPVEDDRLKYISYKDVSFEEAFSGVDVVVNVSNPYFAPVADVLRAAAANKVKLYIPSQFGTDLAAASKDFPNFLALKTEHSNAARAAGLKTVDIPNGLFIDEDQKLMGKKLSVLVQDLEANTVELIGDEKTKINPAFLQDMGKSIAALATVDDYSKLPDTVRIYSDEVTLGDLVAHYEKVNGVKLTTKNVPAAEIIAAAKASFANFSFRDFGLYLRALLALGDGKGVIFESNNQRELVNPGESLFKWTRYQI